VSPLGFDLAAKARRVVIVQLLVTMVIAAAFFTAGQLSGSGLSTGGAGNDSVWDALSALYGGLASVLLALISIMGFTQANEFALSDPKKSLMILYIGAVVRFAAVIVVLGIGLGFIELEPKAMIVGFVLAQISYLMSVRDRKAARSSEKKT
jgi:F0F1-type ATP synthase assembly protein I